MPAKATPLERVLSLRPTNAVARLGPGSRLPVLNPRDLLAVLPRGAALACFPAYAPEAIAALLKASRDEDAVFGISCPWPLSDRDSPARMVEALAREGDGARHSRPLFLQAGPLRLASTDAREVDRLTSAAWDFVEAGFTLISLDASSLDTSAAGAVAQVAQSAIERELSLELTLPLDLDGRFDPARAEAFLEAFSRGGVLPQFLRLPASAYALAPNARLPYELDILVLQMAQEVAEAHGAALAVEQDGPAPEALAEALLDAGVRKLNAVEVCARAVLSSWPPEALEALGDDARAQSVHPRELLRRHAPGVAVADAARLRSEAAHWSAAVELFGALKARGTASRSLARLAEGGRY